MGIDRFLPSQHRFLAPSRLWIAKLSQRQPDGSGLISYAIAETGGSIVHINTLREIVSFVEPFYEKTSAEEIDAINDAMLRFRQENRGKPMPGYEPRSPDGYVYLLKAGPYYKIGVSTQVDERVKQLSTQPPFDIELLHTIPTTDMYALEKDLHELYAPKRKNGEWFELDDSDVEYIKGLN